MLSTKQDGFLTNCSAPVFKFEEKSLSIQTTGITAEATIFADDPMAGDNDADRIPARICPGGANRPRLA